MIINDLTIQTIHSRIPPIKNRARAAWRTGSLNFLTIQSIQSRIPIVKNRVAEGRTQGYTTSGAAAACRRRCVHCQLTRNKKRTLPDKKPYGAMACIGPFIAGGHAEPESRKKIHLLYLSIEGREASRISSSSVRILLSGGWGAQGADGIVPLHKTPMRVRVCMCVCL